MATINSLIKFLQISSFVFNKRKKHTGSEQLEGESDGIIFWGANYPFKCHMIFRKPF